MILAYFAAHAAPWATLAPTALEPTISLSEPVVLAINERRHGDAVIALRAGPRTGLAPAQLADLDFLLAWELVRANQAADAAPLLPSFTQAATPPPAYVALVAGEALVAAGKPAEAIPWLERVSADAAPIAIRGQLALAGAYVASSREADARRVYEAVAARQDPSPGTEKALAWLWQRVGKSSPDALVFARRIYRAYPGSAEDNAIAAWYAPSAADRAYRADRLQEAGANASAVALLKDTVDALPADACVARYAYGRAQNKLNNVTIAAAILDPLGAACKNTEPDRGAKALYLAGKSYERKHESGNAARAYAHIPEWYPTHSMADDGYTLGGIALQESGDLPGARKLWAAGMAAYPTGDLAGENGWRLAWGAWLSGDVAEARRWADKTSTEISLASSPTDVLGAMYWAARWRAWPADNQPTSNLADRAEATMLFEQLAVRAPWHFYGALAAAQLARLDPERAKKLTRPTMDSDQSPWQVPDEFITSNAGQNALALTRVGLPREALAELATMPAETMSGSVAAIRMVLETRAGDFVQGHDRLRTYLKTHPPDGLGPNAYHVLRVAYPNDYWPEVQTAAGAYGWDPRLFHGLIREESNFNKGIKSHAGACGLSQLMPGTASVVAKQMGLSYKSSQIYDVPTNLKIGGYYLDSLLDDYGGNPMLALASYNAGPGNTDRWLAALPADSPADTWAESITFRETRHYVKRVLSTYLTYNLLYGSGPLYPDWSRFVVDAKPSG